LTPASLDAPLDPLPEPELEPPLLPPLDPELEPPLLLLLAPLLLAPLLLAPLLLPETLPELDPPLLPPELELLPPLGGGLLLLLLHAARARAPHPSVAFTIKRPTDVIPFRIRVLPRLSPEIWTWKRTMKRTGRCGSCHPPSPRLAPLPIRPRPPMLTRLTRPLPSQVASDITRVDCTLAWPPERRPMPHRTTKCVLTGLLVAATLATACGQSPSSGASGASGTPEFPVAGSVAFVSSGVSEGTSTTSVVVTLTSAALPLGCSTVCLDGTEILLHVTGWEQTDAAVVLAPGTYSVGFLQPDSGPNLEAYAEILTVQGPEIVTRNDAISATITLSSITSASVSGSYDLTFTNGSVHASFEAQNCGMNPPPLSPLDGGC
jgi:hypothetical protein